MVCGKQKPQPAASDNPALAGGSSFSSRELASNLSVRLDFDDLYSIKIMRNDDLYNIICVDFDDL